MGSITGPKLTIGRHLQVIYYRCVNGPFGYQVHTHNLSGSSSSCQLGPTGLTQTSKEMQDFTHYVVLTTLCVPTLVPLSMV